MKLLLLLISTFSLFAQSTSAAVSTAFNVPIVFPIDPTLRGQDIVQLINTFLTSTTYKTAASEVGIQTTITSNSSYAPAIVNGFIPNVQSILAAPNNTLFIVTYCTTPRSSQPYYIVVPVEQIVTIAYSIQTISPGTFTASHLSNSLSYFPIDLAARAEDIQSIVNTLLTQAPYKTAASTVTLQTTLSGPYYPSFSGGTIPKVLSISLSPASNETMFIVTFQSSSYMPGTVVVAPNQVSKIIYYTNL